MRVDLARELLKNPRKTIDDIAGECGFSDHSHFAKVFKRLTGETPGRYRLLRNTSAPQSSPRANLQAKILLSPQA
ncbi:MAG: AraC family transcriptional regulator [Cupriavidus sp.]|jgi:AraC-like DNA-binding protein|nr:MAG: AraC family transcriptional regulator [Cupriavidus sp.]